MKKIIGSQNEREIKRLSSLVAQTTDIEPEFVQMQTHELQSKSRQLQELIKSKLSEITDTDEDEYFRYLETMLWEILPEAFAIVREVSKRTLGMRHFDVQLVGGVVLHEGKIAEMKTGEGKTLVAALPIYLNGLTGHGAHLITVNDYLARRDALWMGPIYKILGLEVGVINHEVSYKVDWEDPEKAENAIKNNLSVWSDTDIRTDISEDRNLEALASFKTKLVECSRSEAYSANATYGTNNEFGFDYLRDNMKFSLDEYVQKGHIFAIVDEVDSILIDEARTPLIISGPSEDSTQLYYQIDSVVSKLRGDTDFSVDEKTRQVTPTEGGASKLEKILGINNIYDTTHIEILHHVIQALRARNLFHRDVDYMLKDGKVIIVDEFTGRLMPGRRWSDGLHQAIEAKEGVEIESENQTLATITIQNYFRMYRKLSGMTGTADTEAFEFKNIYGLDVIVIPTHKPMIREDYNDSVYKTEREKFGAVIKEIKVLNEKGRPILVGTTSIEKSETLSKMLNKLGIKHQVLNAKHHEREAEIIAQAGRIGAVTIATNMAGRGTDIILGGNPEFLAKDILEKKYKVELHEADSQQFEQVMSEASLICDEEKEKVIEFGGLHIIATERHEARRIDNQLRGRSGRQGDPGSSRFYVALEDDLMRIFASDRISRIMDKLGWQEGEPIEHNMISKSIENAQKRVEARNFDIRKHLLEYDDVLNTQRNVVYTRRKDLLAGYNLKETLREMSEEVLDEIFRNNLPENSNLEEIDFNELIESVHRVFNIQINADDFSSNGMKREDIRDYFTDKVHNYYEVKEKDVGSDILRQVERYIMLQTLDYLWKDHLLNMDHLREGVGLRGYAQKDPLYEYKKEGYQMFTEMLSRFGEDVCEKFYRVQPVNEIDMERLERRRKIEQQRMVLGRGDGEERKPVRRAKKIGRNDPCYCGSGKKYKKCHGRN